MDSQCMKLDQLLPQYIELYTNISYPLEFLKKGI